MYIYYGAGTIMSIVVVFFFIKEFDKIKREKDDYQDKMDLPD